MRLNFHTLTFLLCAAATALVTNCATESIQQLQEKEDKKTQAYENYEKKLEIRNEARQERSDARFDRIMGEPVNSGDTGLKFP